MNLGFFFIKKSKFMILFFSIGNNCAKRPKRFWKKTLMSFAAICPPRKILIFMIEYTKTLLVWMNLGFSLIKKSKIYYSICFSIGNNCAKRPKRIWKKTLMSFAAICQELKLEQNYNLLLIHLTLLVRMNIGFFSEKIEIYDSIFFR